MRKLCQPILVGIFLLLARNASHGQINLDFVDNLNDPGLSSTDVFVTFAATDANLNLGTQAIDFVGGNTTIESGTTLYGTSQAYSLAQIQTDGLTLSSGTSVIGYISYGSANGIQLLQPGVQPNPQDSTVPRYSNFEITYTTGTGGTAGGADLTNISQFGGSLGLAFLNTSGTQNYVENTLDTGDMFRALANTSGYGQFTVITDTNTGRFVRTVGPNTFPASIDGMNVQNPYPGFDAYLQQLYNKYGANTCTPGTLTNLAPGALPGGQGSAGFTATGTFGSILSGSTYNLDYHFTAQVVQVTGSSAGLPYGSYGLVLTGSVNATPATGGSTTTFGNLTINVAADTATNAYMTNFLYTESTTSQGVNASVSGSNWTNLTTAFGSATVQGALEQKAADDFAQGILTGMVGSNTVVASGSLSGLSSYQWWQNPAAAYASGTGNSGYSLWGSVVNTYSSGSNGGVSFDTGGVYGSPYDDRFNQNLIAPDGSTTALQVTLLPDGNLSSVPEPADCLLLIAGGSILAWRRLRLKPS